ncbi:MAG: DUF1343 domain-containing protein [Deltaproteobacteria bacterium]|nr:DUF1343 domain-containing protein [Deltaproteobacteria bacterium]
MTKVVTGLEVFLANPKPALLGRPWGLLANQASVGSNYRHALTLLDDHYPGAIKAIFSPQHGWAGEKQDNMVESSHGQTRDGRPIYSLYGSTRQPQPDMLKQIQVLLIDLPDVGTRVYTFAQTMALCLEVAKENDLEIVILDRPNPIGGLEVEGNIVDEDCRSFVGLHPIPIRHGLTLGELALFINSRLPKPARLTVIACQNWPRSQYFHQTGLPWVTPSPNMPTPETAWVYPGQVLWEGTNIAEARGTTRPFNLMGAPFLDSTLLIRELEKKRLAGVIFREAWFQPTFHKWQNHFCAGLDIHPQDRSFTPFQSSLTILEIILKHWPELLVLKNPPYEYDFKRRPIDLILGRRAIFDDLVAGRSAADICQSQRSELTNWLKDREEFLLYKN